MQSKEITCRFGHICTSRCGNDIDCPCQSEHCCAFTEGCEGGEHCDDHYKNHNAVALGKLGGQSKSEAKIKSSRENGKKGGRPKSKKVVHR